MMKRLIAILCLFVGLSARPAHLFFDLNDFTTANIDNRQVTVVPSSVQVSTPTVYTLDRYKFKTDTNGQGWISNCVGAANYEVSVAGSPVITTFTILVPDTNGVINVSDIIVSGVTVPSGSYSATVQDSRFMLRNNGTASNATFHGSLSITNNATANYVWTCTNATTGEGTWVVTGAGTSLTNVSDSDTTLLVSNTTGSATLQVAGNIVTTGTNYGDGSALTNLNADRYNLAGRANTVWPLTIHTVDNTNVLTHFHTLVLPTNWNGYRYWSAYTPTPDTGRERASVVASRDGIQWVSLMGQDNRIHTNLVRGVNQADTDIALMTNGVMSVFWLEGSDPGYIRRSQSTNGTVWGAADDVYNENGIASPNVVVEANGTLKMWCTKFLGDYTTYTASNTIQVYTSTNAGSNWTYTADATNIITGSPIRQWHFDVDRSGSNYFMCWNSTGVGDDYIHFAHSTNGYSWIVTSNAVPVTSEVTVENLGWNATERHYFTSMELVNNDPPTFDLYICTYDPTIDSSTAGWKLCLKKDVRPFPMEVLTVDTLHTATTRAYDIWVTNDLKWPTAYGIYADGATNFMFGAGGVENWAYWKAGLGIGHVLEIGKRAGTRSMKDLEIASGYTVNGSGSGLSNLVATGSDLLTNNHASSVSFQNDLNLAGVLRVTNAITIHSNANFWNGLNVSNLAYVRADDIGIYTVSGTVGTYIGTSNLLSYDPNNFNRVRAMSTLLNESSSGSNTLIRPSGIVTPHIVTTGLWVYGHVTTGSGFTNYGDGSGLSNVTAVSTASYWPTNTLLLSHSIDESGTWPNALKLTASTGIAFATNGTSLEITATGADVENATNDLNTVLRSYIDTQDANTTNTVTAATNTLNGNLLGYIDTQDAGATNTVTAATNTLNGNILTYIDTEDANTTNTVTAATNALAQNILATVTNLSRIYRTIWIDAGAMVGATNSPSTGSLTNGVGAFVSDTWDLDDTTSEAVQFKIMMPDEWDLGTVKAKVYWTQNNTNANDVVKWGVSAVAVSNDDATGPAFGTEVVVTNTCITQLDLHVTSATPEATVGGTPALGDMIAFKIRRDTVVASDMTGDARLLGVAVQYKELTTIPTQW